jgi:hypothetical protein
MVKKKDSSSKEEVGRKAMRCPRCDCPRYIIASYDFGIDQETGYNDSGEMAICAHCGFEAIAQDFESTDTSPEE